MGNPAGIGPEVVLKALQHAGDIAYDPIIIGDLAFLENVIPSLNIGVKLKEFSRERRSMPGEVSVIDLKNLSSRLQIGVDSPEAGRASAEYIEKAVELWTEGVVDAISTAPISKRSLAMGGYKFPGHTEFLASLTGAEKFAMSFFAGELRVVLLSTHVSLEQAIRLVTHERLTDLIVFTDREMSRLLGRDVKIAVAGLNPHASEGGMFGSEEAEFIIPAVEDCRRIGIDVSGPFSPDTIFLRGYRGEFDAVAACYHDQATIAVKSLSFGSAVNVTLGLPLIRTSVDHGTAFDIAGKGVADEASMRAAFELAGDLAILSATRTANASN
jgi:4-phospho-D-threonate 3-dehydrogenase / 4-phospho-D-erythronate 3-dehydrogenase